MVTGIVPKVNSPPPAPNSRFNILRIVLLVCGLLVAAAAGYRYWDFHHSPHGPQLKIQPASGPVGTHPIVDVFNFVEDQIRVEFCGPNDCVELGTLTQPAQERLGAIPATVGSSEVVPGTWRIKASAGTETVEAPFAVVEFDGGSGPFKAFPALNSIRLADPVKVFSPAACPPSITPDGRIRVTSALVDPTSGLVYDIPFGGHEISWSPKGDRVAIVTDDRKELRLGHPDGKDATTVVREARGFITGVSWSTDAAKLAFVALPDPAVRGGPSAPTVRTFDLVSGQQSDVGPGDAVAWAGDELAIQRAGEIWLGGTNLGPGTNPQASWDHSTLGWVSEGQLVLYRVDNGQKAQTTHGGVCGLGFEPTAEAIYVVSGNGELQRIGIQTR